MVRRKTLDISPVGRVEGDLDVRVELEDGVVSQAWCSAGLFRGFETILVGKDPQAGLVVTPRACGICGASHLYCAAYALDTAWGSEVPANATLLRTFGQLAESMQSIPRWGYASFLTDFANPRYSGSPHYDEAVKRWTPFRGTSYERGVTLSGKPVAAYAVFGGQWPHSSYMVPGGVMCAPTLADLTRARALLDQWRTGWLEPVLLGCNVDRYLELSSLADFEAWLDERPSHAASDLGLLYRMSQETDGPASFGVGLDRYACWGGCPDPDLYRRPTIEGRNQAVSLRSGTYDGVEWHDFDQSLITEDVTRAWYRGSDARHPFDGLTEPIAPTGAGIGHADVTGKYSWSKAPRYDGRNVELGASARQMIAARPGALNHQWSNRFLFDVHQHLGASAMWRAWCRFHEAAVFYRLAIRALDAIDLDGPFYVKPREKADGEGFGATEAIRGALAHWIRIRDGRIENYQIVSPTTFNVGPRDGEDRPGALEAALVGTPVHDVEDPVEVGQVARSFDSCLVCTVHVYDARTHRELSSYALQ